MNDSSRDIHDGGRAETTRATSPLFYYLAHGLRFRSELPCPRAPTWSGGDCDVEIRLGRVPAGLGPVEVRAEKFQATSRESLITTYTIADYYMEDGRRITISPKRADPLEPIQPLLWGWALASLFHQRGVYPLHGSAIESGSGAVVFMGPSGAGKSTIAMELVNRGYRLLDDNLVVALIRDGKACVHPGIPEIKIEPGGVPPAWRDKVFPLGLCSTTKVVVDASDRYAVRTLPLTTVFILNGGSEDRRIARLASIDKLRGLERNVFQKRFVAGSFRRAALFEFLLELGSRVRVVEIREPLSRSFPGSLLDHLERDRWIEPPGPRAHVEEGES